MSWTGSPLQSDATRPALAAGRRSDPAADRHRQAGRGRPHAGRARSVRAAVDQPRDAAPGAAEPCRGRRADARRMAAAGMSRPRCPKEFPNTLESFSETAARLGLTPSSDVLRAEEAAGDTRRGRGARDRARRPAVSPRPHPAPRWRAGRRRYLVLSRSPLVPISAGVDFSNGVPVRPADRCRRRPGARRDHDRGARRRSGACRTISTSRSASRSCDAAADRRCGRPAAAVLDDPLRRRPLPLAHVLLPHG